MTKETKSKKLTPVWRAIVEVGFIVFLFYSNLLMGEFTRTGAGYTHGFVWSLNDIFTTTNFLIAIILGLIGHLVFEFLLKKI